MKQITREQAMKTGDKRYFTGVPCKNGHVAERAVVNATCLGCKRDMDRRQYQADPQKFVRKAAVWAGSNPTRCAELAARPEKREQVRLRANAWRASNRLQHRAYALHWYQKNKDKALVNGRNARARYRSADGKHTVADVRRLFDAQRGMCAACRKSIKAGFHVDHIFPLIRGGSNWPSNLQLLCAFCNLSKHDKDPIVWRQQLGGLL